MDGHASELPQPYLLVWHWVGLDVKDLIHRVGGSAKTFTTKGTKVR
jgi:hypothetical protein